MDGSFISNAERRARRLAAETEAAAEVIQSVLHRVWPDAIRLASLLTGEQREELSISRRRSNACVCVAAVVYQAQVQTGDPMREADTKVHNAAIEADALLFHEDARPSRQGPRQWHSPEEVTDAEQPDEP